MKLKKCPANRVPFWPGPRFAVVGDQKIGCLSQLGADGRVSPGRVTAKKRRIAMTNPKKRKPRMTRMVLTVRSELRMPDEILPWEFELLTQVLSTVNDAQEADSQRTETSL